MKIALFSNPYSTNNRQANAAPSFAARPCAKIPRQINDAFTKLRKEVSKTPDTEQRFSLTVPLYEKADESAAVTVEHKIKKWFLSFFYKNEKESRKAEIMHTSCDNKLAMNSLLKDKAIKKELNKFLTENGVDLTAL